MKLEFLKENKTIIITLIAIVIFHLMENNKNYINNKEKFSYHNNTIMTNYNTAKRSTVISDSFIQNNYIELETKNSEKSKDKIEKQTKTNGGIINQINSFSTLNKIGYDMIIKIPSEKVDNFINNFIKLEGKVINENFSIQNVTNQYNNNIDTIKNLTIRRDRLRGLLKEGNKIDDVLKIDKELTSVQNQLDNLIKHNKNLENDIKLTTITIKLNPKVFLHTNWSISSSFQKALQDLIIFSQNIINLFIYIILFSPYLLFVCIILKIKANGTNKNKYNI